MVTIFLFQGTISSVYSSSPPFVSGHFIQRPFRTKETTSYKTSYKDYLYEVVPEFLHMQTEELSQKDFCKDNCIKLHIEKWGMSTFTLADHTIY